MLTAYRGSPPDIPVGFLKALTHDPGRPHGAPDAPLRFTQGGPAFARQEEGRKAARYGAEKSYNVLGMNTLSQHRPLVAGSSAKHDPVSVPKLL